jgi:Uma2 family endonuclease
VNVDERGLLLVEVADTSLEFDRAVKIPLYAKARVREVWLVDLTSGSVEVHRGPTQEGYRDTQRALRGRRLTLDALREVTVSVDDILA